MQYENLIQRINTLADREKLTKQDLALLSRDLLEFLLETGDIRPINKLLEKGVLTPIHRKTCVLFFQHFVPFKQLKDEKDLFIAFGDKNKKQAERKEVLIREFLNDPLNNLWNWADRNVEIEKREWKISRLTATVQKAKENGYGNDDIILAVLDAGMTPEELLAVMQGFVEAE